MNRRRPTVDQRMAACPTGDDDISSLIRVVITRKRGTFRRTATPRAHALGLDARCEHARPGAHAFGLRAHTIVGMSSEFRKCGFRRSHARRVRSRQSGVASSSPQRGIRDLAAYLFFCSRVTIFWSTTGPLPFTCEDAQDPYKVMCGEPAAPRLAADEKSRQAPLNFQTLPVPVSARPTPSRGNKELAPTFGTPESDGCVRARRADRRHSDSGRVLVRPCRTPIGATAGTAARWRRRWRR